MSFWKGFLNAALSGALQGGAAASQTTGTSLQTTGITAGVGGIAGILQFLLQHPTTAAPAAVAAQPGAVTVKPTV